MDALVERLRDPNPRIRREAVTAMGESGSDATVEHLLAAMRDPHKAVQDAVMAALIRIGGRRAVPGLIALLDEEEPLLRNNARSVLEVVGKGAVDLLIPLTESGSKDLRIFAANILGKTSDPAAIDALSRLLKDDEINVRDAAIVALGEIGDGRAVPHLASFVGTGGSPWIVFSAADALAKIGGDRTIDALAAGLEQQSDGAAVLVIANALSRFKERRAFEALTRKIVSVADDVRHSLVAVIARNFHETINAGDDSLCRCGFWDAVPSALATEADVWSRYYLVEALGKRGAAADVPLIAGYLAHAEPLLNIAAARALGEMKVPAAAEALRAGAGGATDPALAEAIAQSMRKLEAAS